MKPVLKMLKVSLSALIIIFFIGDSLAATSVQDKVIINVGQFIRDTNRRQIGINTNYLYDDDANRAVTPIRSTTQALQDMGVGFLRYPGGEKSDSYLWSVHTLDKSRPTLNPTGPSHWPSNDLRFIENYTQYKINPLDFDEFMDMAKSIGAEVTLVVNFDSMYKPADEGGTAPTKQELINTATAWVRYANVIRGYGIKYWEIGNESYHSGRHGAPPSVVEYVRDLKDFAAAMKSVDPSIKIGANGNNKAWWKYVIENASSSIDFLSVHAYPPYGWGSYEFYRANNPSLTTSFLKAKAALDKYASSADKNRIKILITEMNSADWTYTWPNINNLGHAIVLFDTIGEHIKEPLIETSLVWNTRWMHNNIETTNPDLWDTLTGENKLKATGKALQIWGNYMYDKLVKVFDSNMINGYASYSTSTGELNIFLINKDTSVRAAQIYLENYEPASYTVERRALVGYGPEDVNPQFNQKENVAVSDKKITLSLDPVSIMVLSLSGNQNITNLVSNPGVELGKIAWKNLGNSSVVTSNAFSGAHSLRVETGAGGRDQIMNLQPNKFYTCSAYAKISPAYDKISSSTEKAWIGFTIKRKDGSRIESSKQVTSQLYSRYSFSFTTPNDLQEVHIWSKKNPGFAYFYVDNFSCK